MLLPANSKRQRANLSLDLSDLPPLVQPSAPSNTLLVTNVNNPAVFASSVLSSLHDFIVTSIPESADQGTLHTISPLPSLRRIILTFTSTPAATAIRSLLDGQSLSYYIPGPANPTSTEEQSTASTEPADTATPTTTQPQKTASTTDDRIRVYFGANTPLENILASGNDRYLQAPKSTKQFFISPPPSPPAGWTMRDEDPPNKEVHATDLADALEQMAQDVEESPSSPSGRLRSTDGGKSWTMVTDTVDDSITASPQQEDDASISMSGGRGSPIQGSSTTSATTVTRNRSGSTTRVLYRPEEQGLSPELPAIAVEDTTGEDVDMEGVDGVSPVDIVEGTAAPPPRRNMAHTSRPPVELMS